jgi:hypothetical protein
MIPWLIAPDWKKAVSRKLLTSMVTARSIRDSQLRVKQFWRNSNFGGTGNPCFLAKFPFSSRSDALLKSAMNISEISQ